MAGQVVEAVKSGSVRHFFLVEGCERQCNDAYSAIKIAQALADAFGCGVGGLPLSIVLSWYEQKAMCILLTLLYLGIQNIRLGPTLPAFLSPNVLNYLSKHFHIAAVTTPENDLKALL